MRPGSSSVSPKAGSAKLAKVHVLLLDSSPQVTALFKSMLVEFGFSKVFEANNGYEGVQILHEIRINLIITDWELKVPRHHREAQAEGEETVTTEILPLSGIDFVRRLRRSPSSPNPYTPVIMFVNVIEKMQLFSARDAGVDEICVKPLSAEELSTRIMAVIGNPRIYITAETYKGPDRRRKAIPLPTGEKERRTKEVRIIKNNESVRRLPR